MVQTAFNLLKSTYSSDIYFNSYGKMQPQPVKIYYLLIILFFCFVQVTVLRMVDLDDSEDSSEENEDKIMPPPKPAACAKVNTISR